MQAIITGATGMVGSELLRQLILSDKFSQIISLSRRKTGISHPKLTEYIVNFDQPEEWKKFVKGDVLFSCMGTTLKKAGSKPMQRKIDFDHQYEAARAAKENGVKTFILISSAGASAKSPVFYSRIKGELDEAVMKLGFEKTIIFRPGQLFGKREEKRTSEKSALKIMFFLNWFGLFRKYKPIHAEELSRAMIKSSVGNTSAIYTLNEIFELLN